MMIVFLLSLIFTLAIATLFSPSPTKYGAILTLQALLTTTLMATTTSSWFSLMVFIIFIGGLLVMFAYFITLTPNTKMPHATFITIPLKIAGALTLLFHQCTLPPTEAHSNLSPPITPDTIYIMTNLQTLVIITLVLFLALVMVVKIMSWSKGPLRPF